jgi:hypothetical protein
VTSTDTAGNRDPSPAVHPFTVDFYAPEIVHFAGPETTTTGRARFEFASDDNQAAYVCQIEDLTDPGPCTSPWEVSGLGLGTFTVSVTAIDLAGNRSDPARRTISSLGGPSVLPSTGPFAGPDRAKAPSKKKKRQKKKWKRKRKKQGPPGS